MRKSALARMLFAAFAAVVFAVPMVGCTGVESEPVGVDTEEEDPMEGVDMSQET